MIKYNTKYIMGWTLRVKVELSDISSTEGVGIDGEWCKQRVSDEIDILQTSL
jgi:hypothetical protein